MIDSLEHYYLTLNIIYELPQPLSTSPRRSSIEEGMKREDYILTNVCGLDPEKERELIKEIKDAYEFISKNPKEWLMWLKNHMPSRALSKKG